MSEELKACPFCGIKPELASLVTPVRYFYLCPNCGIGNELQGFDRDEARRFWNTRPIEDKLQAELARRDERIAELEAIVSPASFRKFLVEQIKDPELAEAYVKACIQDTTYKELLASCDEIVTRLKEVLPTLKISHNYCEDCWYSCPKHEDGCCNEAEGEDCNCGADEHNSKIDALMRELEG